MLVFHSDLKLRNTTSNTFFTTKDFTWKHGTKVDWLDCESTKKAHAAKEGATLPYN